MFGNKGSQNFIGQWLAIGVGVGCALGVALGNIATGVGVGIAVGLCLGVIFSRRNGNSAEENVDSKLD